MVVSSEDLPSKGVRPKRCYRRVAKCLRPPDQKCNTKGLMQAMNEVNLIIEKWTV